MATGSHTAGFDLPGHTVFPFTVKMHESSFGTQRYPNLVKRHTKPSQNSAGGIIEKEAMINISNIAFYDEKKQKPSKVGFKILEDGRKVRVSKLTSEVIDK